MADVVGVLVLFTWVSCAIAGAVVAVNRGNNGVAGFIGSAVFGVFGLAMVASAKRGPTINETRCPACAEVLRREAVICPHCRSTFDEAAALRELHRPGQKS
jgi:uncharacterized membrane protein